MCTDRHTVLKTLFNILTAICSSHPSSPNYGRHWTSEKVAQTFAPDEDTITHVKNWLVSAGISPKRIRQSINKGWLTFNATVNEAENLLHTKYHQYEDSETGHAVPACEV
jgi:tripeptidyl-peptidase I